MLGDSKSEHIRNVHMIGKDAHFHIIKRELLALYVNGTSQAEMMEEFGISHHTYKYYKNLLISQCHEDIDEIRALSKDIKDYYRLGYGSQRVMELTGKTNDEILAFCEKHNLPVRPFDYKITRPNQVRNTKLKTTKQVRAQARVTPNVQPRRYSNRTITYKPRKTLAQKIADIEAIEETVTDNDLRGDDSLFCNTEFLESFFGKRLSKRDCK